MLKVWIPGTEDFRDQGLASVTWNNTGATIDSSGKLGKCIKLGASQYLSTTQKFITSQNITVAFWVYLDNVSNNKCIMNGRNAVNKCFAIYTIGSNLRFDTGTNWSTGYALSATTWTHVCFTADGKTQRLYINGQQVTTRSAVFDYSTIANFFTIGCEHTNGSSLSNWLYGKLNDIRIYDECLSPREIKEISKGLVLHYPLNREGFGADNICKNKDVNLTGSDFGSYNTRSYDTENHIGKIQVTDTSHRWNAWRFGPSDLDTTCQELTTGTNTYTVSVDIRVTNYTTGLIACAFDFRTNSTVSASALTLLTVEQCNGNWHRVSCSLTTNDTQNNSCLWCIHSNGSTHGSQTTIEYKNWKLEKGSKATPWIPHKTDELYSKMGLSGGVVFDTSGYKNNGIMAGTFVYSGDTPRYQVSTVFNGSSYIKNTDFNLSHGIWTVAAWYYLPNTLSSYNCILCLSKGNGSDANKKFAMCPNTSYIWFKLEDTYITVNSALKVNQWTHITLTSDGINGKVYVNGQQVATTNITSINSDYTDLVIGARANAENATTIAVPLSGMISDVRIYTTTLSADDILELYQTPISLSSNGTLLTQGEYMEV